MSHPYGGEYWVECEVCGEEFNPDGSESTTRCDECYDEYGELGWPDRF